MVIGKSVWYQIDATISNKKVSPKDPLDMTSIDLIWSSVSEFVKTSVNKNLWR